jgi:hypothetical protein
LIAAAAVPIGLAQLGRTAKKDKGPRAVGLVELSSDGKARLIPVAIMINGKFYDASAYKASPVPMAIWGQTVYEATRTGVSQGLFTVNEAVRAGTAWSANGNWVPAGSKTVKKHTETKPRFEEETGPPKLRRPEAEKKVPSGSGDDKPASTPPATSPSTPAPSTTPSSTTSPTSTTSSAPTPSASPSPDASKSGSDQEKPSDNASAGSMTTSSNDEDPNRPVLSRGKKETLGSTQPAASKSTSTKSGSAPGKGSMDSSKTATKPDDKKSGPQLLPAVSDAGGPDPRPYAYDLKSDEEQKIRKKMLVMISDLIVARAKPVEAPAAPAKTAARPGAPRRAAKAPQPNIDEVQFHAFDLSNTNEPIFVMSVKAQMPPAAGTSVDSGLTYFVTLVVKQDIYAELRKLNATVTDTRHLDETPRMELIDAVDADGDGRGELLFREITDAGNVYGIYRAGADQLFPLFEGTH